MTDDWLQKSLSDTPPPDAAARRRNLNLARAEFERQANLTDIPNPVRQGFGARLRLTLEAFLTKVNNMAFSTKKQMIIGASSLCLLVTSAVLLHQRPEDTSVPQAPVTPSAQQTSADRSLAESLAPELDEAAADAVAVLKQNENSKAGRQAEDQAMAAPAVEEVARVAPPSASIAAAEKRMHSVSNGFYDTAKISPVVPPADYLPQPSAEHRDRFKEVTENSVTQVAQQPVSTFSIDVDTASYSFVRRQLNQGVLPQKDAVRLEEMLNYFDYDYPLPSSKAEPFRSTVMVTPSPWNSANKLVHIAIKGFESTAVEKPKTNLVFLLDVSGSMSSADKLPLVKQSMELLLNTLAPTDTVAIAVYAGAAGTVLEPTPVAEKLKIMQALERLQAGGSTAGGAGISLAYQLAEQHFDKNAVNRIILATDGDFNVGISSDGALQDLVERKREKGIYLSVLGFGQGNYQDALMQTLAQNGNGIAAYIDTLSEAQKVLVNEATSSLFPIANDVKIQVEFNPATVSEYRLLGYETRALRKEDFNNDKVDAGDIGAGHTVTAIYEITPVGNKGLLDDSRYQASEPADGQANEYGFLKLRYKLPGDSQSKLISQPIPVASEVLPERGKLTGLDREIAFATAVAGFAQLLKGGQFTGTYTYDDVIALAQRSKGDDPYGYRTEFVQLVRKAKIAKSP